MDIYGTTNVSPSQAALTASLSAQSELDLSKHEAESALRQLVEVQVSANFCWICGMDFCRRRLLPYILFLWSGSAQQN